MDNHVELNAQNVNEALFWRQQLPDSIVIAGGTDVVPKLNMNSQTRPWIYIGGVRELSYIREAENCLEIGACTCISEIEKSDLVRLRCPLLADAASKMASPQIRNRGTIGGNIVNASPAGDALTALYALGAVVVCSEMQGDTISELKTKIENFVEGPGTTALSSGQIVTKIIVPFQNGRHVFEKIGGRRAIAVSIGSVAILWTEKNNVPVVRIAVGACARTPVVSEFPYILQENAEKQENSIAASLCERLSPISDIRAPAEYRAELIRSILQFHLRGYEKRCS